MSVRVYVPATLNRLRGYVAEGGIGPSPVHAHAVTEWLSTEWPDANDEEWEYAALAAAADDSAVTLAGAPEEDEEPPRRVVIVAEVDHVTPDRDSTRVTVDTPIAMRLVEAVHADTSDVDPRTPESLDDLGWFAVQEIDALLA